MQGQGRGKPKASGQQREGSPSRRHWQFKCVPSAEPKALLVWCPQAPVGRTIQLPQETTHWDQDSSLLPQPRQHREGCSPPRDAHPLPGEADGYLTVTGRRTARVGK